MNNKNKNLISIRIEKYRTASVYIRSDIFNNQT